MIGASGDRRIRLRLSAIMDREVSFAPVEVSNAAFAGYIRNLAAILDHSPLGRCLLRFAAQRGATIGLDPLLEPHASYFYPAQNHFDLGYQPDLLQKSEKGVSRYLISFTGALRRVWHHHLGHGPDASLKPRDFLRHARGAEADVEAVTHLVAWELRSGGASFLWRNLLSGPNGDIAVIFERAVSEIPPGQFAGAALRAAFDQWYAEPARAAACDHFALEMLDLALVQQTGCIGQLPLRPARLAGFGLLPGGRNYLEGRLFTGGWYEGPEDEFNRVHLKHIEQDIAQLLEKTPGGG
jgi:hypothetical protein